MYADQPLRFLQISGMILFHSLIPLILTLLYIPFYKSTRNYCCEYKDIITGKKIIGCLFINIFFRILDYAYTSSLAADPFLLLLEVISGTDLFIRRIPTEFMILLFLNVCLQIRMNPLTSSILPCIIISGIWLLIRKKIGIGLYDALLICILTFPLGGWRGPLLLTSITLILWGAAGVFCGYILQKDPKTKIPMAPVVITAFFLTRFLL